MYKRQVPVSARCTPASTSSWSTVYAEPPVHVIVAPGASAGAGQLAVPLSVPVTATALIVTLPVLVTA